MQIIAIDPGSAQSAAVCMGEDYRPGLFAKASNEAVLDWLRSVDPVDAVVIEQVVSYGMPVGKTVFDTCVWVGRFTEAACRRGMRVEGLERPSVKLHLCGQRRAKDANIRRALIDRFARHDLKTGKGTKQTPDWFYGFSADVWQAYALGVAWMDGAGKEKEA